MHTTIDNSQIFQEILELNLQYHCENREDVREMILSYNESVTAEAREIVRESVLVDASSFPAEKDNWALRASGVSAFGCSFAGMDTANDAMRAVIDHYGTVRRSPDKFMIAHSPEDVATAKKMGKYAMILSAPSCDFLAHSNLFATAQIAANMGLRIVALTHIHSNFAGDTCFSPANCGITREGRNVIKALERFGITVDLRFSSERTAFDALDICSKPAVFSGVNPRALYDHPGNISSELIRKCAEKGGVVCASARPALLWDGVHFPNVDTYVDSIAFLAELVGPEHVGIGIGASAQPGGALRREVRYLTEYGLELEGSESLTYSSYMAGRGYLGCFTEGIGSMANFPNLVECMLRRGFGRDEIRGILGENLLRVFRQTWR